MATLVSVRANAADADLTRNIKEGSGAVANVTPGALSPDDNSPRLVRERWPKEKAVAWAADKGWIVGCDYVPSTAINQLEMWQAETFDPETIDHELALAEGLGFNTVRIFLSNMVYTADPAGFADRFDKVLDICARHGLRTIPTFWTNGGKCRDPKLGKQSDAVKGVHNSQWVTTPGVNYVNHPERWGELEIMVKDIVSTHANDDRILMWCLYNEPENHRPGIDDSVPLMKATFEWARSCNPSQPLTAPIWDEVATQKESLPTRMPEATFVLENSDVLTFHCYREPEALERLIKSLLPYGRPMVCTEYMRRPISTFESSMPVFKKYNVGAVNWGLVAGKCNFYYPWNKVDADGNSIPWEEEPEVWFHDIFHPDGTPWSEREVEYIRSMTGKD